MSAPAVAEVIGLIHDAMWLPRIASWEIAETDGVWGAHGELAGDGSVTAVMALTKLASEVGAEVTETSSRLMVVDFTHQEVPVRVWWLKPLLRWILPETCATCPTKLGAPEVRFVRLGEGGREAPVICVPCRDRMQAQWIATGGAA